MPNATSLFPEYQSDQQTPLAERLRPRCIDDIYGQDHLLAAQTSLLRSILSGKMESSLPSMILWGPPGCGKTTIARLLLEKNQQAALSLSAVTARTQDLRLFCQESRKRKSLGQTSLLFIDEVHRFNRAQQDIFLPFIEDGTIVFIGSTTENPSFALNGALLSRCHVFCFKALTRDAMQHVLARAEKEMALTLPLQDDDKDKLIVLCGGDARVLINRLDILYHYLAEQKDKTAWTWETLQEILQKHVALHDKNQDAHYQLASVLHKSLRASDVDAALYWLARALNGGEDAGFIARRLTRFASEDIGLADPQALAVALHAWDAYTRLGAPEGELALAHAVIYLATAPKSNAAYSAWKKASAVAAETTALQPKWELCNAPTPLMKRLGYHAGYVYDHDEEHAFSGTNCFPAELERQSFYQPQPRGFERILAKRLQWWHQLRLKKAQT